MCVAMFKSVGEGRALLVSLELIFAKSNYGGAIMKFYC